MSILATPPGLTIGEAKPEPISPELITLWRNEPLRFKHALWPDINFYDKQLEIIDSVQNNVETYVPAGNQLGKDFIAGFIAVWFFTVFEFVRVVTTSVKDDHLRVLWGEINSYLSSARAPLRMDRGGPFLVNHRDVRKMVGSPQAREKSYMIGMVSAKGEGLQGHHAPNTLLIIDEASGVDDEVYQMGTTWAKRVLIIGNPLPCTNFFFRGVTAGDKLISDLMSE